MLEIKDILPWLILAGHFSLLMVIDLRVLHKSGVTPSVRRAIGETLFFVANAMVFAGVVYWLYASGMYSNPEQLSPGTALTNYLSGYTIELTLSVDNLFVIAMIFASYKVPARHQHRLLFLGILGAIVFRGILMALGLALMHHIHGISILFGAFLLFTAFRMIRNEDSGETSSQPKWFLRWFNIIPIYDEDRFRTTQNGKRGFTLLFAALLTIEFTDLLFALDSIPAVMAVTTDPLLVFSSNIFAIMGLRSLFFLLANLLDRFHYLKYSVFAILVFVSLKLITSLWLELPEWFSLLLIVTSLGLGIALSLSRPPKS